MTDITSGDDFVASPVDDALDYLLSYELQAVRSVFTSARQRVPYGVSEAAQAFDAALIDLEIRLVAQINKENPPVETETQPAEQGT